MSSIFNRLFAVNFHFFPTENFLYQIFGRWLLKEKKTQEQNNSETFCRKLFNWHVVILNSEKFSLKSIIVIIFESGGFNWLLEQFNVFQFNNFQWWSKGTLSNGQMNNTIDSFSIQVSNHYKNKMMFDYIQFQDMFGLLVLSRKPLLKAGSTKNVKSPAKTRIRWLCFFSSLSRYFCTNTKSSQIFGFFFSNFINCYFFLFLFLYFLYISPANMKFVVIWCYFMIISLQWKFVLLIK